MTIWVILWSDGYDSGQCFVEAYDSEKAANERCGELNEKDKHERHWVEEYDLNSRADYA